MKKGFRSCLCALALCTALTGCSGLFKSDDDAPLPGDRVSILEFEKELEPDNDALLAQGFVAPAPWKNEFWPQAGGYPNHSMQNLALNEGELKEVWQADIGDGARKGLPLTAQPIVVDGRIFTLDTDSEVRAFGIGDGKQLWKHSVRAEGEDDPVIGGGLAYSAGVLYVTTGYDELVALNPENGDILWRAAIKSPSRAAPTVIDGRVFVTTLENRIEALDAADGHLLWEYAALSETSGLVGAASPAADREMVVPAFSSGELIALRVENGSVAWSENLAALRGTGGLASLSDIRGLPVIDKNLIIAISFSGKLLAVDARSGSKIWQKEIGGSHTPWLAGNHLFVLSNDNKVVGLGRDTGAIQWVTQLEKGDPDDPVLWTGPVLAGGRLILAGNTKHVVELDPASGKPLRDWKAGGSVSIQPIVAGETLYLLTDDGTLRAFK